MLLSSSINDANSTTTQVKSIRQGEQKWEYGYDKLGNITRECWQGKAATGGDIGFESDPITSAEGETLSLDLANLESRYQTTYAYDALGQLLRVNDERAGTTWTYAYDLGGNILEKKRYAYTAEADLSGLTPEQTVPYTYGDANWKDKLTAYDGKPITHDAIGNPLTYDGWAYTWKAGRMLHSMVRGGEDAVNAQFTYDHTGLRVKKSVNGVDTLYTLNGRKITHLRKGSNGANGADAVQMHFFYDAQGRPMLVRYNGTDYAYQHNLQGDIVSLVDMNGTAVVEYAYDAWGKPITTEGSMAETLGHANPFRYRGYVWDEETGLYYLRSRYYDPSWGRFVNADVQLAGGNARLFDHNVFSYCRQNPVAFTDSDGLSPVTQAQQFLMTASSADGPSPVGDAIGFIGALLILAVGAFQSAYAPAIPATAIPRSRVTAQTKTQTLDVAPTLPNEEDRIVIYRYGGAAPSNLFPSKRDVDEGDGLSFSTVPRSGAAMTTIGEVNATGLLVAVHDKPKHVSVKPRFATLAIWRDMGAASPFTLVLKAILVKYRGR